MIDNITIGKKIGVGTFGTTYLAQYKNKTYALKIENILYSGHKWIDKVNYKYQLYRELDLYNFINTLNKEDQLFFRKCYSYKVDNNSDYHIQERPINTAEIFKDVDESKWCVKMLLEYKEGITLKKFLLENKLNEKLLLSILIQICKIMLILHNAGYSHGDLHPENIIINKTNKKTFNFMDKKINYNGYQLSAIDYGFVMHKKFGIKYNYLDKLFITNIDKFIFSQMHIYIYNIISNQLKYINDCTFLQSLPWERKNYNMTDNIKKIILNNPDFYKITKDKYLNIYPKAKKSLEMIENNVNNKKEAFDLIKMNKLNEYFNVVNRIESEFHLMNPKLYKKYWKWCSYYEHLLPKEDVLNLLMIDNYQDYVNYLIMKSLE